MKNICKQYGRQDVLKSVSMEFREGVYGLLGKNGAGKTTVIGILLGILQADSGEILIDGKSIRQQGREFRSRIGYLPQYPQFYKEMSVREFLLYMAALKDIPKEQSEDTVDRLIREVNLTDAVKKKVGALSGGMRQRLGIAQAMLNDPDLLILDEPTAGLDPQERIRFRNLISRFAGNRTVILVTHIVSDVEYIANEVIVMDAGEIVCQGKIEELEESIRGKVWEINRREEQNFPELDFSRVSNLKRDGGFTRLRVVSDEPPAEDAVGVQGSLEEVFLYHCAGDDA